MPIPTRCPQCQTAYHLPDSQLGKTVRCKNCAATFFVKAEEDVPTLEAATADEASSVEGVSRSRSREGARASSRYRVEDNRPRQRRFADDEDDEVARGGGGGGGLLILSLVGGVLLLLMLAGGLAWYFASSGPPATQQVIAPAPDPVPPQPQPATPRPDEPRPRPGSEEPAVGPKDVTTALALLQSDNARGRKMGLTWLETAPVEEDRRDEVSRALNPVLNDAGLRREALRVVQRWGSKHNTEKLLPLLEDIDGQIWGPTLEMLAKTENDHAVEAVAQQLPAFGRTSRAAVALRSAAPRLAEKHVVKYLHHPDIGVRDEAGRLLTHYKTPPAVLLEQTNSDLDAKDARTRRTACEWLTKQKPSADTRDKVARTLEGLLSDSDGGVRHSALETLEKWATKDNVKALCEALKDNQLQAGAVKILGKLESVEAITPLALHLNSPQREAIAKILIAFGAKAEKATQIQLTNGDATTRRVACLILAEVGTKESIPVLTKFAKADKLNRDIATAAMKKIQERMK